MTASTIGELYIYELRTGLVRRIERFGSAFAENHVMSLAELARLVLGDVDYLGHFMHAQDDLLFFAVPEELVGLADGRLQRFALIRAIRLLENVRDQLRKRQGWR